MKYVFLVCDGAADWPLDELDGKTIFEAAQTPFMDRIANRGEMGLLKTIPDGMMPGSEVANMSIMGYRPERDLTGRGPLEALSAGVDMSETDIAFRCNLITIENGLIKDYSAGHISTEEGRDLIAFIDKKLGKKSKDPKYNGISFYPGIQYRHILLLDGTKYSEKVKLTPPHDQLDKPYKDFMPKAEDPSEMIQVKTADLLSELIETSNLYLKDHDINRKRANKGLRMATHIWPWSGGKKPAVKPFKEKYGLEGSVISAVDLIFGLGIAAGLTPIHVEGATGLPDTNYEGKAQAALNELKRKDFVYLHVEAPDEMGHAGDLRMKIKALEDFDRKIVGPILNAEEQFDNQLTIVVLPDHPTPIKKRTHTAEPVPFAIYRPDKENKDKDRGFSEKSGREGELGLIENGEDFVNMIIQGT